MADQAAPNIEIQRVSYLALARLFIRMSLVAFGGPAAHIAMGEDEIVKRRGWLTREEYLDMVAATNLIPGPNSTETMIHVGHKKRGIPGAVLAGMCFITPAALISLALAIVYVNYGAVPEVAAMLWGIQPVIVVIIAVAAYRLAPSAMKNVSLWVVFAASLVILIFTPVPEAVVLVGAGVVFALFQGMRRGGVLLVAPLLTAPALLQAAINMGETVRAGVWEVFWYFLRIGSVLFGSGYILVSYLQDDLVHNLGWLSNRELLDAVAIGQFTPGPVLTTATVVGYIIGGIPTAIAATVGIFLPAFVLVILTAPLIPRMRRSAFWSAFLDGINAAVIAAIVITLMRLGLTAFQPLAAGQIAVGNVSLVAVGVAAIAWVGLVRFRVNATFLIILGGAVGILMGLLNAG